MSWPNALVSSTSLHPWRIIPRPLLETILNNFSNHLRVPQPLLLHGPRGVGKTTLLVRRLLPQWNNPPHLTAYVDFSSPPPPNLPHITDLLDRELESLTSHAIRLQLVGSSSVFSAINKWHGIGSALRRIIGPGRLTKRDEMVPVSALWNKAVMGLVNGVGDGEIGDVGGEEGFVREAFGALRVAKEVLGMQREWRRKAVMEVKRSGGFSRSLANSATDWPCLLLQILSDAAQIDFFQVREERFFVDVY